MRSRAVVTRGVLSNRGSCVPCTEHLSGARRKQVIFDRLVLLVLSTTSGDTARARLARSHELLWFRSKCGHRHSSEWRRDEKESWAQERRRQEGQILSLLRRRNCVGESQRDAEIPGKEVGAQRHQDRVCRPDRWVSKWVSGWQAGRQACVPHSSPREVLKCCGF